MTNNLPDLGELEREVMLLVWNHGPITAEAVREKLTRPLKESTVRTVLRRLEDKGYVIHRVEGRTFHFMAAEKRGAVAAKAVQKILDWFTNGSLEEVLVGMVDNKKLDPRQLQALSDKIAKAREEMSLALLLESALRALGLGAGVWLFLRLTRLRDTPTETLIWTMVLLMALAMPVLMPALERWSPALALHLPRLAQVSGNISPVAIAANPNWLAAHGAALLWSLYFLIAAIGVARLALGLVLTARLYRRAQPVRASWAQGRAIRASAAIRGPIAFGTAILLPADYRNWPQAKLAAVLAHEESHVRRGDFFIQLLASLYRALFWFSPFAWWLQTHLCALGESASDAAAVRVAGDRACYAEILIEVSRQAQSLGGLSVAMAKGPDIAWRIDRILDESAAERALGQKARLATAAMILPLALAIAGAHAAIPAPLQMAQAVRAVPAARPAASAAKAAPATSTPIPTSRPALRPVRPAPPVQAEAPAPPEETVSYNPRALLDGPTIAMVPALIVTGGSQ